MSAKLYSLKNDQFQITVSEFGAELQSLNDLNHDLELLWQGDEKYWGRRAPILFPIVGRLKNDKLIYQNKEHPLTQHGFARDLAFELIYQSEKQLEFKLSANEITREKYPFDFELIISYLLEHNVLTINHVVRNLGNGELPFSVGGHPAFNWPLLSSIEKDNHTIEFECNQIAHVRQLESGLLKHESFPSPIKNKIIHLKDDLFNHDALIFDDIHNRKVRYKAEDKYSIIVQFSDFPQFGLWSKPGAPFICLEPWYGYASPVDFDGDIRTKPGIILLPEHGETQLAYSICMENKL